MAKVNFNPVTEDEDIRCLADMASVIWHEYFPGIINVEQIDYMVDLFLSYEAIKEEIKEGYEFYFENNGEENVGFMVVKPEEDRLFISKLYIHEKFRGRGYGSPMFEHAVKIAVERGLRKMYLTVNKENESSINTYKHKGFEIIDSVKNDIGNGFFMDDYIFECSISKGQEARKYFEQGYNCSQAVAMAFADEIKMEKNVIAKAVSGFGGGMGRMREVCGAVSGMVYVAGCLYGYDNSEEYDGKAELYKIIQELAGRFKLKNGSIVCRELLGLEKMRDDPRPEERTEEYYKKRPCGLLVNDAADILEEFINDFSK